MSGNPFWTDADAAELDVLTFEFVGIAWRHREICDTCAGGPWCEPMRKAFAIVEDFQRGRQLRNRAAWLRAQEAA